MIESEIETKVSSQTVWQAWKKAHAMDATFLPGHKGALKTEGGSRFTYRILDVRDGESFTILWKSMFVRLIFTHAVIPQLRGAKISYRVQIKGFFAWPVRYFLSEKIRRNLKSILKSLVKELESSR
ncbi:MAG: hypothetical protein HW387_1051 [Parachlamydiales bacterium]|nr:hypothetical protein [Parachlamydiales bacterium]